MTKKLALLGVATLVLASLSGCLLPCEICLACANAGTSASVANAVVHQHDDHTVKEIGPQLQQTAWKNAVAH